MSLLLIFRNIQSESISKIKRTQKLKYAWIIVQKTMLEKKKILVTSIVFFFPYNCFIFFQNHSKSGLYSIGLRLVSLIYDIKAACCCSDLKLTFVVIDCCKRQNRKCLSYLKTKFLHLIVHQIAMSFNEPKNEGFCKD